MSSSSSRRSLLVSLMPLALAGAAACFGSSGASDGPGGPGDGTNADGGKGGEGGIGDDGGGPAPLPFAPDSPYVYVAKVKNVLVGLPPTDDEMKSVVADPSHLGVLVDAWMKLPQYETKMRRFFQLAFQQTQISAGDFGDQLNPGQLQLDPNRATQALFLQSVQESFARTMLDPAMQSQPFTRAMSTTSFAMTTALKVFYGLLDVWQIDDAGRLKDAFQIANPNLTITVQTAPVSPPSSSFDPTSANYMHFQDPDVAQLGGGAGCATDPITYPARASTLYDILFGVLPGRKLADGTACPSGGGQKAASAQLQAADFSDWTMVNVRAPAGGEATTPFYDLSKLRGASEMVLGMPRVGFFSTPAFFANWQTNDSNQMRATLNQTLIVATGAQIDGNDPTVPTSTPGLDSAHASTPDCVSCHQLLDPTRSILAATYSWNYHTQVDPTYASQPGLFAFQGVQAQVKTISDFAGTLASHPRVAEAWANKLCFYVDSEACVGSDPELRKVIDAFTSSGYSWSALVKALVTSPITTHTASSVTATTNGEMVAVARRDHLCAMWNARFGFADICGLDAAQAALAPAGALAIVTGLPSDGYGRGSVAPVVPNQPSLFYRAGVENLCETIAGIVVDAKKPPPGAKTWSSAQPDAAIADFVALVMGLTASDPRAATASTVLHAHFDAAKQQGGLTVTDALQSTFTLACMSPSAVSMGM